ncbi:MAG: hypothetical protein IPH50_10220 [Rhodanobacteraceae bacterium]|nr:hypothetical protein [Rhodanobacteraceae bacterium]
MKRGAILRIPGESGPAGAVGCAEAAAEIVSQNQSWIESTRPTTVADASVESSMSVIPVAASTRPGSRLNWPPASGQSTSDRPGAPGGTGESADGARRIGAPGILEQRPAGKRRIAFGG